MLRKHLMWHFPGMDVLRNEYVNVVFDHCQHDGRLPGGPVYKKRTRLVTNLRALDVLGLR